jgi:hypothetical protein
MLRCERVECHSDYECPSNRACQYNRCVDPCSINPPCGRNANCFVRNHVASCSCPENMPLGDPQSYCERRPVIKDESQCEYDGDCPSKLACIRNICVNPCHELQPCAKSAKCSVLDSVPVRTMVCECPELWVPDLNGECRRVVLATPPGCTSDNECPTTESCINRQCRNPCDCGSHSTCTVLNHRATCSCENGYDGNPNIACRLVGCKSDSECDSGKACINENCINPCIENNPCGTYAECYAHGSQSECRCLSGYHGNPRDICHVIGCRSNNDCPTDKRCENSQCINPCVYDNPCAPRAECRAQNHMGVCRCTPGFNGNPYINCKVEDTPECEYDTDCPTRLACINKQCVNPCTTLEPCQLPARCEVVPSPVRTMICICPEGYISSGSGTCKPVIKEGCISDSDCSADKSCINSICRDPCNCGPHSVCRIKDHKPVCSCEQGYEGNPEIECIKIGCTSNEECSGQHVCQNRQCIPVCASDGTSCGILAQCSGINHRAICECAPGLTGDPSSSCVTLGCRTDTECPTNKACINSKCESPCEKTAICGKNEICQVYQHRPECACPPGFIGNYEKGCVQQDEICRSDMDCPTQTACISGECVNPCNATNPCGVNSICKVLDTIPVRTMICECLPGYQGNAAIQCDKSKLTLENNKTKKTFLNEYWFPTGAVCSIVKGLERDANGNCACPPGHAFNLYEECQPCRVESGLKIDETGHCVCALERGMVIDERGRCVCYVDQGYRMTERGECIRSDTPECETDEDCPDYRYCNTEKKTCDDPCLEKQCGVNALCNATNHQAICACIYGYGGDAEVGCSK